MCSLSSRRGGCFSVKAAKISAYRVSNSIHASSAIKLRNFTHENATMMSKKICAGCNQTKENSSVPVGARIPMNKTPAAFSHQDVDKLDTKTNMLCVTLCCSSNNKNLLVEAAHVDSYS